VAAAVATYKLLRSGSREAQRRCLIGLPSPATPTARTHLALVSLGHEHVETFDERPQSRAAADDRFQIPDTQPAAINGDERSPAGRLADERLAVNASVSRR
jgi:hypothetical protein